MFDDAGVKLESAGDGQEPEVNLAEVEPSSIVLDDGNSYNIQYTLIDGVLLTLTGTRVITQLPEGAQVGVSEEISLANLDDEVWEAEIQYSKFGEVLYGAKLTCAELSVISYCQSAALLRGVTAQSRVLFAGVNE
ncbi:hypothetical protein [Mesorhizobium sp. M0199]|uniref:hypothetical protein n=1 Tax=Mesorhizobium sp. M0199 TaxID=2956911 RepID=UPI003339F211